MSFQNGPIRHQRGELQLPTPLPGQLSNLCWGLQLHGAGAPCCLNGADGAPKRAADGTWDLIPPSPGPANENKLQVGHLSSALLLLFLQQESLSSGGRRKNLGCSGLFFSSWIASFCSWGHRDEQGGSSTGAFPSSCCSCRPWGRASSEDLEVPLARKPRLGHGLGCAGADCLHSLFHIKS